LQQLVPLEQFVVHLGLAARRRSHRSSASLPQSESRRGISRAWRSMAAGRTVLRIDHDQEDDVVEIGVTADDGGGAMLDLAGEGGGEVRDSVALDELEAAER